MLTVIQSNETPQQASKYALKNSVVKKLQNLLPEQWEITGGLSCSTKMPGFSISTPASACIAGSKLAEVKGSVCNGCYAKRGNYPYQTVQNALRQRMYSLNNPLWIPSMVALITKGCELINESYFRWFDSGDLQGIWNLQNIVEVCKLTPRIKHWLPTREYKMVNDYQKEFGNFPDNLIVRASAHMIDGEAPKDFEHTSTVSRLYSAKDKQGILCEAYTRENSCGNCRSCWDKDVKDITYHKH